MSQAPTRRRFLEQAIGAAGAALPVAAPRRATAQTPVTVEYLIRIQEMGFPYSEHPLHRVAHETQALERMGSEEGQTFVPANDEPSDPPALTYTPRVCRVGTP